MDLRQLQEEVRIWTGHNFPNALPWEPLLGVQEEAGEIAHAFLKRHQQVRTGESHFDKMVDAVGDLVIFLTHFCTLNGISLPAAIESTWAEVKQRDWKQFPKNGRTG